MRVRLLLIALAASAPLLGQEFAVDLDPAQTHIQFTLSATLHTVHGSFKLKHGAVRFDPATGKITGDIVVDSSSGESGDQARDRRMQQEVLESSRYPEIIFTPDRLEGTLAPQGQSHVQVHGTFRIHGAAHDITIPVEVTRSVGRITAASHFEIPYAKWGMRNPSTLLLRVSGKVEIDVSASTP